MAKASTESHGRLSAKAAELQKRPVHKTNTQAPIHRYKTCKHAETATKPCIPERLRLASECQKPSAHNLVPRRLSARRKRNRVMGRQSARAPEWLSGGVAEHLSDQ